MGLGWLVIGTLELALSGVMRAAAVIWIVLGVAYFASGMATFRWGDMTQVRYPVRWFPFWPPDEDER